MGPVSKLLRGPFFGNESLVSGTVVTHVGAPVAGGSRIIETDVSVVATPMPKPHGPSTALFVKGRRHNKGRFGRLRRHLNSMYRHDNNKQHCILSVRNWNRNINFRKISIEKT
ncbi:hypothetical protein TNCV_1373471 [Trichonephila clavipes]|uniref:Uncharacterized protein n=1 Tax=Trichonephila clavipes TaxID=2585209 RepID=A0A8X6WIB7_TRICX|nr:hypothetical protein TNCV_1373471 [Trichonephila clavipes]